jgi:hypothetical protein
MRSLILAASLLFIFGVPLQAQVWAGPQVKYVLEQLFVTENVPGTTVATTDDIANGSWSFSESNMVGLSVGFNNNRHLFKFSEDGVNPIAFDNDLPWDVRFDIQLDATLATPRKAFNFTLFNSGSNSGVPDSQINLTSNRSPVGNTGLNDPPGESAMFSGQYNFLRLIGPQDGADNINPNPTVGYATGTTINMHLIHTPSPDNGVTPARIEYIYTDSSGSYTNADSSGIAPADPTMLRNSGEFVDGYNMGFILQGIAHSGTPVDSYGVTITNFQASIGAMGVPGDYNENNIVDAADYTVWRNRLGQNITLPNEVETPHIVTIEDYNFWKAHFGATSGSGAGSVAQSSPVPEPSVSALLLATGALFGHRRRRYRFAVILDQTC